MKASSPITKLLTRLAINHARRSSVESLIHDGMDPRVAENHVAAIDDTDIQDFIAHQKMKFGALGDGGIIQWLKDHSDQILAIVKFIMSLVAMFAATGLKTPKLSAMLADIKNCSTDSAKPEDKETP